MNEMKTLAFHWKAKKSLAEQLSGGVTHISVRIDHGRAITVILWRSRNEGLMIKSHMHDIAERIEIGVLEFSEAFKTEGQEINLELKGFGPNSKVKKLSINESGVIAESGVVMEGERAQELIIVAGAHPFSLAVNAPGLNIPFESEYPLERYTRVPLRLEREKP